ncbi:papain-like cysteine protease family protein [Sinorhizobium medicae]|uniref:papain-like cysteine protease family protein n=1 Tax=Sinorhizobium medicae TaxID=110321 RepID=UPI002AF6C19F|nr:papain-like cysteine protease family protein [Sinorhizobium medicae]WQO65028.1 papain-like cysteine protease family protein [Sinorhizobium medicae]WQO72114.1 papain-like cysteine protease family protein [Sinorhizobium medicae]WQO91459.1 papain-like cysteine protease family protein [Sinorhizobium medicae]
MDETGRALRPYDASPENDHEVATWVARLSGGQMQANDAHQQLSEPSLGGFDTDLDSGTIGRASLGESMHMPAQPSLGYGEFSSAPPFGGWFSKKSSGSKAASSSHNEASEANELPQFRLYHVPYISQGSERRGCWYACARMVAYSVETGPRLGLPELYNPQSGHDGLQDLTHAEQFILNEGLSKVDLPDSQEFSHEELGELLYRHGPIIFGWQTPQGIWHMSVLTGVDKHTGSVVFHDPQKGPDLTMPLDYFNQRLAWQVPHAMLYR